MNCEHGRRISTVSRKPERTGAGFAQANAGTAEACQVECLRYTALPEDRIRHAGSKYTFLIPNIFGFHFLSSIHQAEGLNDFIPVFLGWSRIKNVDTEHLVAGELEASVIVLDFILIFPPPKNSFKSIARRATFRAPFRLTFAMLKWVLRRCPKSENSDWVGSTDPEARTRSLQ